MKNLLFPIAIASVLPLAARADDTPAQPAPEPPASSAPAVQATERDCGNHADDDNDAVYDCGDADCAGEPHCQPDGRPESTDERCSNWLDDDGDGQIDCEDQECKFGDITVCAGSWRGDLEGDGGEASATPAQPGGPRKAVYGGDVEQPDSEGGVGFVGVRFGVVAAVQQLLTTTNLNDPAVYQTRLDTRFDTLQLRAFGALPLLEDSFFLLSMAAAQSPRITFAMFQFPLGQGHYFNINTGGSTLSVQPLISAAKRPLLDTPRYLLVPFDQFLDAGIEFNGPIVLNLARYRVFAGGGSGLFGDFGGRRFEDVTVNPTYSVGAQAWVTPVGIYSRFDTPFLYRPVPTAVAFALGGKWEQREQERFPAVHATAIVRSGIFSASVESYNKAEINFGSLQTANYLQLGLLLWPEWFFLAADIGHYYTTAPNELSRYGIPIAGDPNDIPNALKRNRNQIQSRTALHWFFWRQNGVLTARYTFDTTDPLKIGPQADRSFPVITHEAVLQAQLRF